MEESPLILVVDDMPAMRLGLTHLLRTAGYRVIEAGDATEAWAAVQEHRPSLVLLDVVLPDESGTEVLRRIKSTPDLRGIFVVHLSASRIDAEDKTSGLDAGADDYISLPVSNAELLARVRSFLRQKETLDALAASERQYRSLFSTSPQPMWIYDTASREIVATNQAFQRLYSYSEFDAKRLKTDDLYTERPPEGRGNRGLETTHRTNFGHFVEVEMVEQDIVWNARAARLVLVTDLTLRRAIEQHHEQLLEGYRHEIRVLEQLRPSVTPEALNEPLARRQPDDFTAVVSEYAKVVEAAVEERIFKMPRRAARSVELLAARLHKLSAAHTDVVAIHAAAMQSLPKRPSPAAQAHDDIARFVLLQLMGFLVADYRRTALCAESTA